MTQNLFHLTGLIRISNGYAIFAHGVYLAKFGRAPHSAWYGPDGKVFVSETEADAYAEATHYGTKVELTKMKMC